MNLLELLRPYYNPDNGDRVLHVYIVGPYPTEDFFRQLFSLKFVDKRTNIITFLVDKSSYDKAIEIKNNLIKDKYCTNTQFVIKAISGDKGRFVHSKMYYFEIEKPSGMIYTCLITGSGNASTRAYSFESDDYKNAEINLVTTIKQEDREFIENYFTFIENDTNILHITAADTKVYFPNIKSIDIKKQQFQYPTFSSWILNGYVYHKYNKANDLGKIRITLKNKLEWTSVLTHLAAKNEFVGNDQLHSLSYNYVGIKDYVYNENYRDYRDDIDGIDDRDDRDDIKRFFLCETSYGYWAPRELKKYIDKEISRKDNTNKQRILDAISMLDTSMIEAKVDEILERINNIFTGLDESSRHVYFNVNGNNELDKEYYRDIIKGQISKQNRQCKNKSFYERYLNGYNYFNASYLENCVDEIVDEVQEYIDIKLKNNRIFNIVCQAVNNLNIDETSFYNERFFENNLYEIIYNIQNIAENRQNKNSTQI